MQNISEAEAIIAQSLIAAGGIAVGADSSRVQAALVAVAKAVRPLEALPYQAVRDVFLSGQIPDQELPKLISSMPEEFQLWWEHQSSPETT